MGCFTSKNKQQNSDIIDDLLNYTKEGWIGRTAILYHATSSEAAFKILNSEKMLRGKKGLYGGGIYFADTPEIADYKATGHDAVIEAEVYLGISLIVTKKQTNMTATLLQRKFGCDSVKGIKPVRMIE